jgi:hypothetical protein
LGQSVVVSSFWIAADSDTPLERLDRILVATDRKSKPP